MMKNKERFLHFLRVIKHRIRYFPEELRYYYDIYSPPFIHRWFLIFGYRIGILRHYSPIPFKIPASYYVPIVVLNPPKISIVTPSYNQADFIDETLKSVINQNYPNLEYFVQDGGSTDNTMAIVQKYQEKLAGFTSQKDDGQSHAINLGMHKTSGEIMAWINSDDLLLPGALNTVGDFFATHPEVDVVYGNRMIIDENSQQIGRWILPNHDNEVLSWGDFIPQETLFWRRKIWEQVGGLNNACQFALDWDLLLRFRDAGAIFHRIPRFLGAFRVHAMQKTSSQMTQIGKKEMEAIRLRTLGFIPTDDEIYKAVIPYLRKHKIEDVRWKINDMLGKS